MSQKSRYSDAWKCGNVNFCGTFLFVFFCIFLRKNLQNTICSSYLCSGFRGRVTHATGMYAMVARWSRGAFDNGAT